MKLTLISRYILIVIADLIIIIGSSIKAHIDRDFRTFYEWNLCSVFLGIGNLFVWFGVLRYLQFYKTYNVVILTLKKGFTKIIRFLVASLIIFLAYVFCGWLVFGPFQPKFRTISSTSNCLFSLGDGLYGIFATIPTKSATLWWFAQFYLYSFMVIYAYVILSLFISVICDAYETIQTYYEEGFPLSEVKKFAGVQTESDLIEGVFMKEGIDDFEGVKITIILERMFCGCDKKGRNDVTTNITRTLETSI